MSLFGLFRKKASFRDDMISLVLSNDDVTDREIGITDGYTFYIYANDTRSYCGYVSLRLGESEGLYYLGHIGYRIEPAWRGHGFACRACRLIVPLMQSLNLRSVVITANVDNVPSRRTCENLGCVLESIADVPPAYRALCAGAEKKCRYIWLVPQRRDTL